MASNKINVTLPGVPQIEVKMDGAWQKVENLINGMPYSVKQGYDNGIMRCSKSIIRIVKRAMKSGMPPKGARWPALSPATIRAHGKHNIYHMRGFYADSIGVYHYKNRTLVGVPLDKRLPKGNITLNQLGIILEHGSKTSGDGAIPKRPLWAPAFHKEYGGNDKVKRIILQEIRRKLIATHGLHANQIKEVR